MKTQEELQKENDELKLKESIRLAIEKEREVSKTLYAEKWIERIVIAFLGTAASGVLIYLGTLVIKLIEIHS